MNNEDVKAAMFIVVFFIVWIAALLLVVNYAIDVLDALVRIADALEIIGRGEQ